MAESEDVARSSADVASRRGVRRAEDEPDARFYAGGGLSPEQTLRQARNNLSRLVASIAEHGRSQPAITPDRLLSWHRGLFGRLFPSDAGRWRQPYEDVAFPVLIEEAGRVAPVVVTGSSADEIPAAVGRACDGLAGRIHEAQSRVAAELRRCRVGSCRVHAGPVADPSLRRRQSRLSPHRPSSYSSPGVPPYGAMTTTSSRPRSSCRSSMTLNLWQICSPDGSRRPRVTDAGVNPPSAAAGLAPCRPTRVRRVPRAPRHRSPPGASGAIAELARATPGADRAGP